MAAGLYDSIKVEVEFNPALGVFTDLTAYVDLVDGVKVEFGRADEFSEVSAGTCTVTLWNDTGNFTTDNPLSTYYPNVVEGRRLRVIVTKGATTSTRFFGRIASWDPSFADGEPNNATTVVTAVDCFALLARRTYKCDYSERWEASARTYGIDFWPLDDKDSDGNGISNPTTFANSTGGEPGYVQYAKGGVGSITMEDPDGVILDGSIAIEAIAGKGPIAIFETRQSSVEAIVIPFRTAEVYDGNVKWIASGRAADGTTLWSLRVDNNAGQTDLNVYDGNDVLVSTAYSNWAPVGGTVGDDQWYVFQITSDATDTDIWMIRAFDQTTVDFNSVSLATLNIASTRYVVLGGRYNPLVRSGNQISCLTAKYGAVAFSDTKFFVGYLHVGFMAVNQVEPAFTRLSSDLATYAGFGTTGATGSDNPDVMLKRLTGRTADECVNELARTVGGVVYPRYGLLEDTRLTLKRADVMRLPTVALTVDVEADLDASNGLPLARDTASKPTRVTATWPAGQVTTIGDESRERLDDDVDTTAATEAQALSVATARLNRSTATRIKQLRVDLVTAENDLYAATLALTIGDRVRLSNLPPTALGVTYVDSYVQGWAETWTIDNVVFDLDLSAADSPVEGVFDDAEYGRFAADGTLQLAYPTTSSATTPVVQPVVVGAPVFTTDAGDYPLDVDLLGERVTCNAAPSNVTRTNRCTNPSMETNATGWGSAGGYTAATYAVSTDRYLFGSQSLLCTWGNVSSAASIAAFAFTGLTVGQRYHFSVYAYVPGALSGGVTGSPDVRVVEAAGAGTSVTYDQQTTGGVRDGWVRLSMSLTASAVSHTFGVVNDAAATTGQRVWLDGCLMEQTTLGLGLFFDGATNGGAWTGTAHASTSTVTCQQLAVSARGVAPSIARAHTSGEAVDCWHAAGFTY